MKLTNIKKAEFVRNVFAALVPVGTNFSDFEKPENWAHVAASLHRNDRVELATEDGLKFAEFHIVAAGKNWARAAMIKSYDFGTAQQEAPADNEYYVKWGSPTVGFRVHRYSDKQVVKDKLESKEVAVAWIKDNCNLSNPHASADLL